MKIAIMADIHANLEAAEAVLKDIDKERVQKLLFAGDIVDFGASPRECIGFVMQYADKIVAGNHDYAVAHGVDCLCHEDFRELSQATKEYTWRVIEGYDQQYLRDMSVEVQFVIEGKRFYMVHGAPSDHLYKYLVPETPEKTWQEEISGIKADFIVLGHTHIPLVKKIGDTTIINPGSVGQPRDGNPDASYALIDDDLISIRRVKYDIDLAVKKIYELPLKKEIKEGLENILRRGY